MIGLDETTTSTHAAPQCERLIGRYVGAAAGPTVVCVAGVHGNEPAGIAAAQHVLDTLHHVNPTFCGEFVALMGNLPAIELGVRFIDGDLNRMWTTEQLSALRADPMLATDNAERRQQVELSRAIHAVGLRARGRVHFMDLHTASGEGPPFAVVSDTLPNRRFAMRFPVPMVLGLEEAIDGTLQEFVTGFGAVCMSFEGGQHDSPLAVDQIEAALWVALVQAGNVSDRHVPRFDQIVSRLAAACKGLPPILEVRHRHALFGLSGFRMEPGYGNFDRVERGQILATDKNGPIKALEAGRVLLPLYQGLGNDGFFLAREVRPFWLTVSAWLRMLRIERIIHWLPGVRRYPKVQDCLIVDRHVARWYVYELFHLLGYRKRRDQADQVVLSRRSHDEMPWEHHGTFWDAPQDWVAQ